MPKPHIYFQIKSGQVKVHKRSPLLLKFWRYVDMNGPIHPVHGQCWMWKGRVGKDGYGSIIKESKRRMAHRISWELNVGEIKDGFFVLHKCDNPSCTNPDHLFIGTIADNSKDMSLKDRQPNAYLSSKQVREIRKKYRRYRNGSNRNLLAKEYGCQPRTISELMAGKTYYHVTPESE